MLRHRVIPILLVQDGGLVKTRRFSKPNYVGDPVNAIRIFNEKEVDELSLLEISATSRAEGPDYRLVEEVASECFMPLSYGGGIRSAEDARRLFSLGVEKVIIQSAALDDLGIVESIAAFGGSQSVTVSVDVKKTRLGRDSLYNASKRCFVREDWLVFAKQAQARGAGEVLLTSVDREGSMAGLNLDLIRQASDALNVPLVAHGGVGSLAHIKEAVDAGADAVGAGSFFVYRGPRRGVLITYPEYCELTKLLGERHV